MSATRYGLLELWNDLENLFNRFNAENMIPASSQEDDDAFALAHKALKEMIDDGRKSQAIYTLWDPVGKATLGLKAKNALFTNFGPEETPPIKGIKSLAFLREVILPHIENAQKVEYDDMFVCLCSYVGIDVPAEKVRAAALAENYKRIIAKAEMDEAPKEISGEQFRLFRSSSKETLSAPALDATAAAAAASIDVRLPGLNN